MEHVTQAEARFLLMEVEANRISWDRNRWVSLDGIP